MIEPFCRNVSERVGGITRFNIGKDMRIHGQEDLSPSNSKNCSFEGSIVNRVPVFQHFVSMRSKVNGSEVSGSMNDSFNLFNQEEDTINENLQKNLDSVIDKLINMVNFRCISMMHELSEFRDCLHAGSHGDEANRQLMPKDFVKKLNFLEINLIKVLTIISGLKSPKNGRRSRIKIPLVE